MLELHFDGEKRVLVGGLLVLVVEGASALVGLGALEGSDEGVGEGRGVEERRGSREAVEGDIETELEGSGLERVRGVGFETGAAEEGERGGVGGEESGGYMERGYMGMAATGG